ncbi:aminoimidazole ribonucleotide synthetase [Atractiella rhizophila]|nr:aminoimidazole ribonucleotide synthetase [Atractiella rhizophila]
MPPPFSISEPLYEPDNPSSTFPPHQQALTDNSKFYRHLDTSKLRILLIGSGGREHALAWKLAQSPRVDQIFVAPGSPFSLLLVKRKGLRDGNGGIIDIQNTVNVNIQVDDFDGLVTFSATSNVNLVIVGPEQPLVDGVESAFKAANIPFFGPTTAAAALEGSKQMAKDFMQRYNVPTSNHRSFDDKEACMEYVKSLPMWDSEPPIGVDGKEKPRIVLKASQLCSGKGVYLTYTLEQAVENLNILFDLKNPSSFARTTPFRPAVVVEDVVEGQEFSILALCDGYTAKILGVAQDHKRVGEGDTGPMTGGMGAYAVRKGDGAAGIWWTAELEKKVMDRILVPTLYGMRKESKPFVGMLFTGIMLTPSGEPMVLEYNVRFGDPETQTILPLLNSNTDLSALIVACIDRRLDCVDLEIDDVHAVSVSVCSKGYPGDYEKGQVITIPPLYEIPEDIQIFHAGTKFEGGKLLTNGGRVLTIVGTGKTLEEAREKAYSACKLVDFDGAFFRKDIGYRAIEAGKRASTSKGLTYADAGVSIDNGVRLVKAIKPFVKTTRRSGSNAEIGGFGGLFDLKQTGYKDPILVAGTDGVGTKLELARKAGKHKGVGIDLVAMSVNDLLVQGAEPLFFLDYFACNRLTVETAVEVVKGVAEGCKTAGCALIGGETAEMPDMYKDDDYDLAGFAVGAVERDQVLPSRKLSKGDKIIGLSSSGIHSNGFSLVRKILSRSNLSLSSLCPPLNGTTIADALLEPTKIYVPQILPILKSRPGSILAMSHITGGGFPENAPRMFEGTSLGCLIDLKAWNLPPLFGWLAKEGNVEAVEMIRTFNCGIGLLLVVKKGMEETILNEVTKDGSKAWIIGEVKDGEGLEIRNIEAWGL